MTIGDDRMFRQPDFYNLGAGHGHGPGLPQPLGQPGMHEPSKVVKLNYTPFSQFIHSHATKNIFYSS